MIQVDMHMHSIHSDGCKDASQMVKELLKKNITLFALSDHDTLEGLPDMMVAVKDTSLKFVPSVEVSSSFEGREYHLLAYGFSWEDEGFLGMLKNHQSIRRQYDLDLMDALIKEKVLGVCHEGFKNYQENPYHGGWKSLNYLKSLGLVKNFMDYLALTPKSVNKMVFTHPKDVIEVLHRSGGKVFLAHPSSNGEGGLPLRILDQFKSYGLDGIECYSPYHKSVDEVDYYLSYCKKNHLLISGGSDYHGDFIGRKLGEPKITSSCIDYDFFCSLALKNK